ncbi:hypothetical protein VNO78_10068 [Psophocarpus tetragonolobus]|uniref:Uncharacterized protein n=1 Tax=Psophocarpus tetragonolobus TaxID=3891 RepID=A0AAN9SJ66_PSOTE
MENFPAKRCGNCSGFHEDLESVLARSDDEGINSVNSIMAEWENGFEEWLDGEAEDKIACLAERFHMNKVGTSLNDVSSSVAINLGTRIGVCIGERIPPLDVVAFAWVFRLLQLWAQEGYDSILKFLPTTCWDMAGLSAVMQHAAIFVEHTGETMIMHQDRCGFVGKITSISTYRNLAAISSVIISWFQIVSS